MVYVDEISQRPRTQRWPYQGSSHLMADSLEELDVFAQSIGLSATWRHNDHYDLTRTKRQLAIEHGAKPVSARALVAIRRRLRGERA